MADKRTGDDCIAIKENSTNIHIKNVVCYGSNGIPIGSIGHDVNRPTGVENVLVENVILHDSDNAAWIKTFVGHNPAESSSTGGASGFIKNVTFRNFQLDNVNLPIYVSQCIYSRDASICDLSKVRKLLVSPSKGVVMQMENDEVEM